MRVAGMRGCAAVVCPHAKPVGELDAGNLHVRFDERGRETESRHGLRHRRSGESRRSQRLPMPTITARVLDSTRPNKGTGLRKAGRVSTEGMRS
jgi:hypothetical protein